MMFTKIIKMQRVPIMVNGERNFLGSFSIPAHKLMLGDMSLIAVIMIVAIVPPREKTKVARMMHCKVNLL